MLDEDLSCAAGVGGDGRAAVAAGAVPRRAARRRRPRGRRLSGRAESGQVDHRARRRGGGARRARVSRRHRQARRRARHRRRPRADRRRPRARRIARRSTSPIAPRRTIRFDGMQFRRDIGRKALAARRLSDRRADRRPDEVRRRHVRLPRQPGRLAGDRSATARARRRPTRRRRGRPGHRQHLLGHGDRRSGCAPDDPAHRAQQSRRRVVVTGCYATRRPDELARAPERHARRRATPTRTTRRIESADRERSLVTATARAAHALAPGVAGRTALTLRVQTGCEERCSYCIIPQTRGASRSRPLDGCRRRHRPRGRRRLQGDRDHRRPPRLVRPRPRPTDRR